MSNTSATGGYLAPTAAPIEDEALVDFLQTVVVGITGLDGEFVRPLWQRNPADTPDLDVDWCAIGVVNKVGDFDPVLEQQDDGTADLERHESFGLRCVFYGPRCSGNASRFRDGLDIPQNRVALRAAGVTYGEASDPLYAPELVNDRYVDRLDQTFAMRRVIRRSYPILHFLAAEGTATGCGSREIETAIAVQE